MKITAHLAKHLREAYNGRNWTWVDVKTALDGVTYEDAVKQYKGLNSILALLYHINYYVRTQTDILNGKPLNASDKHSFGHPEIHSQEEWEAFVQQCFEEAEALAKLMEAFPEERLWDTFVSEKYGTYFRNFQGNVEHIHYHMGQIVLIRKLLSSSPKSSQ